MRKPLHIICGNCGNGEEFTYTIGGEFIMIDCKVCFKSTDLAGIMSNSGIKLSAPPYFPTLPNSDGKWKVKMEMCEPNFGSKLHTVKFIKDITGCGLKEAKDIFDQCLVIKSGIDRKTAEDIAKELNLLGASVSVFSDF